MVQHRHKLIVGLDFGTTYTGIAYINSQNPTDALVRVITNWPGGVTGKSSEYLEKVPSAVSYDFDNPSQRQHIQWGYQIKPGNRNYTWMKLLLDENALATDYDDPALKTSIGSGMLGLPPNKSAVDVVADYLSGVYNHLMKCLREVNPLLDMTPIEFWCTVPAMWSEKAQDATLEAAKKAGFGSRDRDEVFQIKEPEAAAYAALKSIASNLANVLDLGSSVLVCDCGGGTVDLTSYVVVALDPSLQLEEACVGIGGKCGATYIDRNLRDLLAKRYGPAFTNLPMSKTGPGSRVMIDFESVKKSFDGDSSTTILPLRLIMKNFTRGFFNSRGYDPEEGEIQLSYQDVQSCFDPIIDKIQDLVSQQVTATSKEGSTSIKTIILVGGLGSSPYLWKRMKAWCNQNGGLRFMTPDHPWSAVSRGAALNGLEGSLVTKWRCRRHYGIAMSMRFREGIDDPNLSYVSLFYPCKYARNRVSWKFPKGDILTRDTINTIHISRDHYQQDDKHFSATLVSCNSEEAPDYFSDERVEVVGKLDVDFREVNLANLESTVDKNSCKVWEFCYEVQVTIGDKTGALLFKAFHSGKEFGKTSIRYACAGTKSSAWGYRET
ncbi:MAG: hypothetical protein M1834_000959 [Cirrosporium novae-zelandiae]|nr:MAG: hypothetical protein M1834_000959 [Cirrosporium novae-zelandiae]